MLLVYLTKIRFLQFLRGVRDIGIVRVAFLLIILCPALVLFLHRYLTISIYSYAISGCFLLLVFMIHRNRKDHRFLTKTFNPPAWAYFVEYLTFSTPFLILLIVYQQYIQLLFYIALLIPVCFIIPSPKTTRTYNMLNKYIPSKAFEWQSGFRKNMPVIIVFYAIGLVGIYKIGFAAASVALLSMIVLSFYAENEPLQILSAPEQNATDFLKFKLFQHIKYGILFLLPLFILAFFHYEYWLYILTAFISMINLVIFSILSKYAFYRPTTSGGLAPLIGALAWLCTIILPLSVFVLITNIVLVFKAKQNLNHYLNAYD